MNDLPEIKREYLDDDFSERKIREIRKAVMRSEKLKKELMRYNKTAERTKDKDFYRKKMEEVYSRVNSTNKVAEVKRAVSGTWSETGSSEDSSDVKTPVLKGIVVDEFDGKRIWIEPESMIKGQYGVQIPDGFKPEDLPVGTEVAVDPQNFDITEVLEKKKDSQFRPADTGVTFSDIGGLDDVIEILKKNIGVQIDPDKRSIAMEWGVDLDKCLLLIGKPGTGKTMLAKAVANEYDAEIFTINAPQLVEKFIGEGAKKIKKLYSQASNSERPSIIFIDEIDAIGKSRDENRRHGGEEVERTMSQLLSELDGIDKDEGDQSVVSIFATNKPSVLDSAIINRCSALEVPVPDREARLDIFRIHTRGLPLEEGVDYSSLVDMMEDDSTGRDIAQVCKQAAVSAISRPQSDEPVVTMEDFQNAIVDMEEGKIGMEKDFLLDEKYPGEIFA